MTTNILGTATILARDGSKNLDKLTRGCFFGDYIFLKETVSLFTIIADSPGVECLLLSRRDFLDHFHDTEDFLHGKLHITSEKQNYYNVYSFWDMDHFFLDYNEHIKYDRLELKNLKILKTLGIGGFGRVELVQNTKRKDDIFALKLMKKYEINGQTQIDQVYYI